jgi:tRNA nucleotidyltransferase (CCA-adding enzyme)
MLVDALQRLHDHPRVVRIERRIAGRLEHMDEVLAPWVDPSLDPDAAWPEMKKLGRKLFRQLGELRDTQVLEEWTKKLSSEADPVRQMLLEEVKKQETAKSKLQPDNAAENEDSEAQ